MSVEIRANVIPIELCEQLVERGEKLLLSEHMVLKKGVGTGAEPTIQKTSDNRKFGDLDKDGLVKDFGNDFEEENYINLVRPNYEEYQGYFPAVKYTDEELEAKLAISEQAWIDAVLSHCVALCTDEMSKFYDLEIEPDQGGLVKMKTGARNGMHYDQRNAFAEEAFENLDPSQWPRVSEYSFLIYLNENGVGYTGGDLVFPNYGLTLKPKAGMCVFFVGDEEHIHEVTEITSGNRYSILGFSSEKGNPISSGPRIPPNENEL